MLFFLPQLLIAFLALASIRVYTELLSPVGVGQVMLLLSFLALVQVIFTSSLEQSIFYIVSKKGSAGLLEKFVKSIGFLKVASAAVVVTVAVLLFSLISKEAMGGDAFLVAGGAITVCGLVCDTYRSVLMTIANVERRHRIYHALISADAIIAFGASAAILSIQPTIGGFLLSYGLARSISYLLTSATIRTASAPISAEGVLTAREITYGSLPFALMGILGWCTAHLDRFVVASSIGTADAGHYAVASSLVGRPYSVLTSALTVKYKPALFAKTDSVPVKASSAFRLWCCTATLLATCGIVCFAVLAESRGIEVLVGPIAPMVSDLLIIFAIAFTLTTLTHPIENAYLSYGRSKYLLSIQLAYLPLSLFLLGSFCFIWGTTGAVWARILSEGIKLPILFLLLKENR